MTGDLERLPSPRIAGGVTYLAQSYGDDGRFVVRRVLATAGQGYALQVEDTWSRGPAVLKGMWWYSGQLTDRQSAGSAVSQRNQKLLEGRRVINRATQVTQQAPVVTATLWDPSPAMLGSGSAEPFDEVFIVQQFLGRFDGTQWCAAPTLREQLDAGTRMSVAELLDLADQLCGALAALHAPRGNRAAGHWVHCDVKPENILVLGPPARYVLIDYDGAVESGCYVELTSQPYAPPDPEERQKANQRFDIYMLGATLAHAAGLTPLAEEIKLALCGTIEQHLAAKKDLYRLGYGPILTSVIATCLAASKLRYSTVATIQNELARARHTAALHRALGDL